MLLNTQVHGPKEPWTILFLCCLLTALAWSASDYIYYEYIDEAETRVSSRYWYANSLLVILNLMFTFFNVTFLWIAYFDAWRRNALMMHLTQSLELFFYDKKSISVRFPTINFLDTETLLSWLDARRVALDIGVRF